MPVGRCGAGAAGVEIRAPFTQQPFTQQPFTQQPFTQQPSPSSHSRSSPSPSSRSRSSRIPRDPVLSNSTFYLAPSPTPDQAARSLPRQRRPSAGRRGGGRSTHARPAASATPALSITVRDARRSGPDLHAPCVSARRRSAGEDRRPGHWPGECRRVRSPPTCLKSCDRWRARVSTRRDRRLSSGGAAASR